MCTPPAISRLLLLLLLLLLESASSGLPLKTGSLPQPAAAPPAPAPLLPSWAPTYDLQRSLVAMPCNESGWSNAAEFAKIGIVTYDMNNAHDVWEATVPSSPEEVLEQQCAKTKAASKEVKCGVYRNSAHMWSNYLTVRKALQDPAYWGYFLPWANTTARNYSSDRAGENLYYDTTQTPHLAVAPWNGKCQCVDQSGAYGAKPCTDGPLCECGEGLPCGQVRPSTLIPFPTHDPPHPNSIGPSRRPCLSASVSLSPSLSLSLTPPPRVQFMFDFRNSSLLHWLLNDYIGGPLGLGSPNVDFVFLDDEWDDPAGPSEVGAGALQRMGLSKADVTELTAAYWKTMRAMQVCVCVCVCVCVRASHFPLRHSCPHAKLKGLVPRIGGHCGQGWLRVARIFHRRSHQPHQSAP